jgi:ribosome recycling factor
MSLEEVLLDAEEKMEKTTHHTQGEFATVRTGKASPDLVNHLQVDVYGSQMRLKDIAAITTPDSRLIMIQPWDVSNVDPIRKAIEESRLGINPLVDGKLIRLPIPELSTERRLEMVKTIKRVAEEGRVALRGVRRASLDELKKLQKNGELTEDGLKGAETEMQKLTDQYTAEIEKSFLHKEAELLKV